MVRTDFFSDAAAFGHGVEAGVAAEPLSAEVGEADVHGDAGGPSEELGAAVELGEPGDDADHGVLADIGGLARVSHAQADGEESLLVALEERTPGIGVAGADGGDQREVRAIVGLRVA